MNITKIFEIPGDQPLSKTWCCAGCATVRTLDKQVQETTYKWTFFTCPDCKQAKFNEDAYLMRPRTDDDPPV